MRLLIKTTIVVFFLFTTQLYIEIVSAQTTKELKIVRQERISKIHLHHVGIGVDISAYNNYSVGPHFFYGIGTHRNLLNADVGFGYSFANSVRTKHSDAIACQYVGLFASGQVNFIHWHSGSMYIGTKIEYNISTISLYKSSVLGTIVSDKHIGKSHCTTYGKLGLKLNHWDFNIYIKYNISPAINQKYIYETSNFDYDSVYNQLYDRIHFGLSLSYLIPF